MAARIDKLDLKMLRVLAVLAQTRNTYRAAEQLHLSQSAVSRALSKLRDALEDPVFVRSSDGLEATALTERIVARLPELFELMEDVVDTDNEFRPEQWTGSVSITLSSPTTRGWASQLYARLAERAPNVTWNFETWRSTSVVDILEGRVAFGIHYYNEKWPQTLYQQNVGKDDYVLLARKKHPGMRGKPSMELFRKYQLVSLLLPDWNDYDNRLESELRAHGIEPQVAMRTDNLAMALDIVGNSDKIMAGTQAMAQKLDELKSLPYPPEIALPDSTLVMCYPRRLRNSARYNWLAEQVTQVLSA